MRIRATPSVARIVRLPISTAALVLFALGVGCSMPERADRARVATGEFRTRMDQGDLKVIHETASEEFQAAVPLGEFVRFEKAIRNRLGRVQSSKEQNWLGFQGAETRVTLVYEVKYEKGDAIETFIWRVGRQGAELLGWDVRSEQLFYGTD